MSVETLLTRYSLAAQARGLSPETVTAVKVAVRHFATFLDGIPDVRKVSPQDLQRFILALRQRKKWQGREQQGQQTLSANSVRSYVKSIKSFWSWLKREGLISKDPLQDVPVPRAGKRLPKIYSEEELVRVLRAAAGNDRDDAMISLFLDSGIRLAELVGLNKADVDTRAGTARVTGKGNKQRIVCFEKQTALAIGLYILDSRPEPIAEDRLFLTETGCPMSKDRVQKLLVKLGQRAGLSQRLSPHRLRHSYATLSLKYGCNLEALRRSLGHSRISTTEQYLHLADADAAEAHKKSSPLMNLLARRR